MADSSIYQLCLPYTFTFTSIDLLFVRVWPLATHMYVPLSAPLTLIRLNVLFSFPDPSGSGTPSFSQVTSAGGFPPFASHKHVKSSPSFTIKGSVQLMVTIELTVMKISKVSRGKYMLCTGWEVRTGKNIFPRSQEAAEGRGTLLRPREDIFPVRTDLNGK